MKNYMKAAERRELAKMQQPELADRIDGHYEKMKLRAAHMLQKLREKREADSLRGGDPLVEKKNREKRLRREELRTLAQEHGSECIDLLIQIARDFEHRGQVYAIRELLDRGYGKAKNNHNITADVEHTIKRVILVDGPYDRSAQAKREITPESAPKLLDSVTGEEVPPQNA